MIKKLTQLMELAIDPYSNNRVIDYDILQDVPLQRAMNQFMRDARVKTFNEAALRFSNSVMGCGTHHSRWDLPQNVLSVWFLMGSKNRVELRQEMTDDGQVAGTYSIMVVQDGKVVGSEGINPELSSPVITAIDRFIGTIKSAFRMFGGEYP